MTVNPSDHAVTGSRIRGLLRGGTAIAVAILVMNISTYGFQMVAARLLGPEQYGGVARLMALFLVVSVAQLGLQATAARRISATPGSVGQIERVILAVGLRAALVLGLVMLLASPLVWHFLKLDSIVPAICLAVGTVPLTMQGAYAGILQGERRWIPLGLLYLASGVPRLALGTVAVLVRPTEGAAMAAVALATFAPVVVGWVALRRSRAPGDHHEHNRVRPTLVETLHSSMALLAFYTLSSIDVIIAGNVLTKTESGLYAGGLILTKAVLFLPQFVVVVAFPSMSTAAERRKAVLSSLAAVAGLGACCTIGALVLSDFVMIFVGGAKYGAVEPRLWVFAVLGTLLAALQLLVYSVLARQSRRSGYLVWIAVAALVVGCLTVSTLDALVRTVVVVDAVLLAVLLALSLYRMKDDQALGRSTD